jgi:CubicO group peptidase (beta-lactamase class C family)
MNARRTLVHKTAILVSLISIAIAPPARGQDARSAPADLDAYIAKAMQTFEVPGLALAVVKDGRVVVSKGYGVRRLGDPAPVDARTLFGIASNTKVFTAVALGILVEEGKLAWDAPVIQYLPWFQMWDPYVTRELTIRDLLVHRSGLGLGAGDLLWWPASTYDRHEIVRRLRYIPPATSFRSAYAYDNVLYLVAGEVIEAIAGQSWEDFVSSRILAPVEMKTSNVRHSGATSGGNVATTHAPVKGAVRPIKPFDSDNTNPAGGINSNADDMARWLTVLMAHGQLGSGKRLFSDATWRQITTIVTPQSVPTPPPELAGLRANVRGYALGLGVTDYRGQKVLLHTGGLPGYVSRVLLVPDQSLGIAVLTNQESGEAFDAIAYRIVDHFLNAPPTDWVSAYRAVAERSRATTQKSVAAASAKRDASSRPSLPLANYAGIYRDGWYGDIAIEQKDGGLRIRFTRTPSLAGVLEHWQHDTFVAKWDDRELRADAYVTFALKPDGSIDQVKLQAVSPDTDFSYDFQDLLLKPVPPRR